MLPSVVAVVDIGSNSVKILVAKMQQDGLAEIHLDAETTSLARALPQTGKLGDPSIAATLQTIQRFRAKIDELGIRRVRVVGTAALREASNAVALTVPLEQILGHRVEIISGIEEARLALKGALTARPDGVPESACAFADLGGASTELGYGEPELAIVSTSLGALKTHNLLGLDGEPVSDSKWRECQEFIRNTLTKEVSPDLKKEMMVKKTFIAVGGTIVMAMRVLGLTPFKNSCYEFEATALAALAERLRKINELERSRVPHLHRDRADILPFGMLVLTEIMHFFGQPRGVSTVRGLRHGIALTMLDRAV